jgi:4-nitrophenyl phosphatase
VLFVTNNSYSVVSDQEKALAKIGIDARNDVITSSQAAGSLLRKGERVLLGGGPGAVEAIRNAGAILAGRSDDHLNVESLTAEMRSETDQSFDVVMVGYHPTFDYRGLTRLSHAVRGGARLIATNDDATYPTPHGLIPGGGSILAAVVAASGVEPIVAGKPYEPIADLVRRVLGITDLSDAWMVGDRPSTDGLFAQTVGCKFAQVLTGISSADKSSDTALNLPIENLHVYADLAAFAKMIVGS